MRITTHGRFRWEYMLDESKRETFCLPKRWRLFAEEVKEPVIVTTLQEAHDLLGRDHPAYGACCELFMGERQRIEFLPWRPFEPSAELLEALGPYVVERVEQDRRDRKVWSSVDGWTWLHVFGDSAVKSVPCTREGSE